jgi:hypothetical protein
VIEAAHVDVVNVEQQTAIRLFSHLSHKVPLGHR